jgi:hypothetical protein
MHPNFWPENLKIRNNLEEYDTDKKIIEVDIKEM